MNSIPHLSCRDANQLDLVDYLGALGYEPQGIRGNDYWYLSPLRQEKTASFKVNRTLNLWYDHGNGKGGTLVDFGILYFGCTVKDLLAQLGGERQFNFSFQPRHFTLADRNKESAEKTGKIKVISSQPINDPLLINYLQQRSIPLTIARQYCEEICFQLYEKKQLAIGFKNDNGGYELRSPNFKGSSSPKEPKLISKEGAKTLVVFEGFFSFLSYKTVQETSPDKKSALPNLQADSLVLNSLSFFENSRSRMEQYENIHLFLDRDKAGRAATVNALQWSEKYKDSSGLYASFKDINDYLIDSLKPLIKQGYRQGMHL